MSYSMQSYHAGVWTPMEDGPAKAVWKPRAKAHEAVRKCIEWTGGVCIPAMRVVDLSDGSVVWQDRWEGADHELARIIPDWAPSIYRQVQAEQYEARAVLDRAVDEFVPVRVPVDDGALFSLSEVAA